MIKRSGAQVTRYQVQNRAWSCAPLQIVVISDLHIVHPWTSLRHLFGLVEQINAFSPDIVLLPGDFIASRKIAGRPATAFEIVDALRGLEAPLGVFATLGNHDWADDRLARSNGFRRTSVTDAFDASSIRLLSNEAVKVLHQGTEFWLIGLDSQQGEGPFFNPKPKHDLALAMMDVPDGDSSILMAHEPDIWESEKPNATLTVSGHTHGGQIAFGSWRPVVPSKYGAKYAYGRFEDGNRNLVVTSGIGYSGAPIRIGAPSEIVLIELSAG